MAMRLSFTIFSLRIHYLVALMQCNISVLNQIQILVQLQQIMKVAQPSKRQVEELSRISQALGVLKWTPDGTFSHFKLAYHPFCTPKRFYAHLGELQTIWQKVLLRVARDKKFLIDLLSPLAKRDEMIAGLLKILHKKRPQSLEQGLVFDRIDYYIDEKGQPKLTQFNLLAVGMQSNMEKFQEAKALIEGDPSYVKSPTISNFAVAAKQIVKLTNNPGIVLFVILSKEANYLDQVRFQIELRKQSFKVVRVNIKEIAQKISLRENNDLYFGEERVALVYYRSCYRLDQMRFGEGYNIETSWEAQEKIQLSNAIMVPPVEFRLANLKRVQTELGKNDVLRRYATQEEAEILNRTRVKEWDFDTISQEQLKELIEHIQKDPKEYLLKPNMEGGGNNFFDSEMITKLKNSSLEELRSYILMQKIHTPAIENGIIVDESFVTQACEYEVSRYGTLSWFDGEIVRNQADGFLVRAKPPTSNEGGIMAGIGSIVTWKLT